MTHEYQSERELVNRLSKHKRKGSPERGPTAAAKYLTRKRVSRAHGSSIRKLQRADRIANGKRPLRYDTSWMRGDQ
jgi:hypothetical protein